MVGGSRANNTGNPLNAAEMYPTVHVKSREVCYRNVEASFRQSSTFPIRTHGSSLAPIVTIFTCLHLLAGLPIMNWARFFIWLAVGLGLVIYFSGARMWNGLRKDLGVVQS